MLLNRFFSHTLLVTPPFGILDDRGVQARHLLAAGSVACTLLAVHHTVVDGVCLALERLVVAVVALPVRHAGLLVVQVQRTLHRKAGEGHAAHEHLRLGRRHRS